MMLTLTHVYWSLLIAVMQRLFMSIILKSIYKCLENVCYFGWGPANFRSCLVAFDDREASTQTEPLNRI